LDIAGPDSVFTVEFASFGRALEAYHEGLRHGLVTVPMRRKVQVGEELAVQLYLAFADLALFAQGRVVHVSGLATIVKLDEVPEELHEILAQPVPEFGRVSADVQIEEDWADEDGGGETVLTPAIQAEPGATTDKEIPVVPDFGGSESILPMGAEATMPSMVNEHAHHRRPSALESAETKKNLAADERSASPSGGTAEPDGFPLPGEVDVYLPAVVLFDAELARKDLASILLTLLNERRTGVLVLDFP
jgi:hypothetical protein